MVSLCLVVIAIVTLVVDYGKLSHTSRQRGMKLTPEAEKYPSLLCPPPVSSCIFLLCLYHLLLNLSLLNQHILILNLIGRNVCFCNWVQSTNYSSWLLRLCYRLNFLSQNEMKNTLKLRKKNTMIYELAYMTTAS